MKCLVTAVFMSVACLAHGATISTFCTTGLGPVPPSSGTTTSTCPGLPTPDGTINFITLTYQYDLTIGIGAGSATFTHDVNYGGVLDGFDDLTPQTVTNLSRPQTVHHTGWNSSRVGFHVECTRCGRDHHRALRQCNWRHLGCFLRFRLDGQLHASWCSDPGTSRDGSCRRRVDGLGVGGSSPSHPRRLG